MKLFTFGYLYYWSGTVLNVPRMQQAILVCVPPLPHSLRGRRGHVSGRVSFFVSPPLRNRAQAALYALGVCMTSFTYEMQALIESLMCVLPSPPSPPLQQLHSGDGVRAGRVRRDVTHIRLNAL